MRNRAWVLAASVVLLASGILLAQAAQAPPQGFPPRNIIPAYHPAPPKGRLAPTLPASDFTDPVTAHCYAAAARIKSVLYQLPCYCGCDREDGHTSLLSCYQDRHTAGCATCKMELYYAYQQTRKGRSAAQIRQGIIRGDWKKVDVTKWSGPAPAKSPKSK
ncbi:MAG TPA: CYCXC family (seleno)protein [Candidatus Acidoferrales bacterium]|nr:CYCXC family (seleno)protein [Candidatus Acidoferrales bacterium]